uniref:Uncharacterized protein n=1 Tax=uncultured organism MedDCM-OCT-S08-C100 TaxID=743626 RepID=D6PJ52_9ZZZZ|nr:hypothetical protein [uncultured organism MedDCM-OCT-S08-C100]
MLSNDKIAREIKLTALVDLIALKKAKKVKLTKQIKEIEKYKATLDDKLQISQKEGTVRQYKQFLKLKQQLKVKVLKIQLDLEKLQKEEQKYNLQHNSIKEQIQQKETKVTNL